MENSIILITGANKGIGYEAARFLSEKLDAATTVILMGTRSVRNGEDALRKMRAANASHTYANIHPLELDVTSGKSIAAAVESVKARHGKLDVLINNSGIANEDLREAGAVFAVNYYGVKDMITAFDPIMPASAKTIIVSSEVGAWTVHEMNPELRSTFDKVESLTAADVDRLAEDFLQFAAGKPTKHDWASASKWFGSYGLSKSHISALAQVLARTRPDRRLAVVCPGFCATDLNGNRGHRPAAVGGESIVWPVLNDGWKQGGFYQDGNVHPYNSEMSARTREMMIGFQKSRESAAAAKA
ncbi:hypothetical protein HK101_007922 [Irineochytrium annulatum]|nr:hypothetical protein HK101_007922 [Irineochytrium annulatum]